jgi:UDP-2,3-diacylglucosamine pyrophosphatase LpxH
VKQKPITIIVSDLHLGGGKADPGDDHVYQKGQFSKFILEGIPESKEGKVELFINGDFLEFAQVKPDVYTLGSSRYWCSETESLEKLSAILSGHKNIFLALKEFQEKDNFVTIAAGNHDVDLYWKRVQEEIRKVAGPVQFAIGDEWYHRYSGRLMISHGHMIDPANKFKRWKNPIRKGPKGIPRLEMCPGTLFMVKFVNWLDERYPFSDNVKPIMNLARLLYKEPKGGFKAVLWTLLKFAGSHPIKALSVQDEKNLKPVLNFGDDILNEIAFNDKFLEELAVIYNKMGKLAMTPEKIRKNLKSEEDLFNFLKDIIVKLSPEDWLPVFNASTPSALGIGDNKARTLSIVRSGMSKDKENLREEAITQLSSPDVEVVVCGHTHQPDEWRGPKGKWDGGYFNPGSWTRYLDISKAKNLTLADLKREEDFPYQLNYIRVEESSSGKLRASKVCFEKQQGTKWSLS